MARYRPSNAELLRSDVPHRTQPTPASTHSYRIPPSTMASGGKGKTGVGIGAGGKGLGQGGKTPKRHRKILRDNIQGVTKGDIRRLARRGGVKRISGQIYDETRSVLRIRLTDILKDICAVVESCGRKTVCVTDVVFVLNRLGRPIYGFGEGAR
ncbi:Histone H4 [Fulvia fulva]|uniref:Histone H4 n=1 Tax=Passalora fulva TaxID=5499 RepID=A0A9Q8US96_PASFU|nr:Histone H4 [Fulvia fulva]KAK4618232.1 Histone H4 [Fulvia fulva]KAK4618869.1 Histone H4 [Fulvia fulva]UJO20546.1 Histone H4 [Fulvia fulva]WPV17879.1 Histone H4 [Fulvia fulva]WPV33417.1 Histone H4 [Fulvia fulva]